MNGILPYATKCDNCKRVTAPIATLTFLISSGRAFSTWQCVPCLEAQKLSVRAEMLSFEDRTRLERFRAEGAAAAPIESTEK